MEKESDSSSVGQVEAKHPDISTEPLSRTATYPWPLSWEVRVVEAAPNCLELRPSNWSLFAQGILILMFLLLLARDIVLKHWWWVVLWAVLLVGEFLMTIGGFRSWVRLDRNTNSLTLGRRFRSVNQALGDVVTVQLLKETMGFGRYQLNLVFADPSRPRLNLCASRKSDAIRKMGQAIADFLNVPLLDQTQQVKPKAADSTV